MKGHTSKFVIKHIYRYPKFLLFFITLLIAYLLFYGRNYPLFQDFVFGLGYFGTFLTGILFTYGFTAAPATAIFLILAQHQNIYLTSVIGGLGALIGDLFIFSFIRHSFSDEIKKLSKEKIVKYFGGRLPGVLKKYLLLFAAGFIIASPFPDEIGVSLMAASKIISPKVFSIISYLLNTSGIFLIMVIGNTI